MPRRREVDTNVVSFLRMQRVGPLLEALTVLICTPLQGSRLPQQGGHRVRGPAQPGRPAQSGYQGITNRLAEDCGFSLTSSLLANHWSLDVFSLLAGLRP